MQDVRAGYTRVSTDDNTGLDGDNHSSGVSYHLSLIKPWSWDRHSINLLLEGGGLDTDEVIPLDIQDLGGLFRLSGYQRYELSGRYSLFGGLRYIYRVADNDFGALRAPSIWAAPSNGAGSGTRARISAWRAPSSQVPSMWG